MDINLLTKKIEELGIVPVVKLNSAADALPLAKALIDGGLPVAEITFRTDAAEESIRRIAEKYPDMLVGAGTVLTIEQADRAVAAGAKFVVTPGFNYKVVSHCVAHQIPIFPGCPTTSDIEQAIELGLKVVKFFPAEQLGGIATIKAVSAPYGGIRFMPTGGVNEKNLLTYLSSDKIVACGGSWMVKPELIDAGEFDKIEALTRSAVSSMLGFKIGHVGVNCGTPEEGDKVAKRFCAMFGWEYLPGEGADFCGDNIEVMKTPWLGKNGHICVYTNSFKRAAAWLQAGGIEIDWSTANDPEKPTVAYLKEEVGGFAVHLKQK